MSINQRAWTGRVMTQGESLVAMAWLTVVLTTVISLVAMVWWNASSSRGVVLESHKANVDSTVRMLAQAGRDGLAADDLEAFGRLTKTAIDDGPIQGVRLVRGGQELFSIGNPVERVDAIDQLVLKAITIGTAQGGTELQVTHTLKPEATASFAHWYGVGLIVVLAMAAIMLTYRQLLRRVRAIGVVRECLQSIESGEEDFESLRIGENLGEEARVWNYLVDEVNRLRRGEMLERAVNTVGGGGGQTRDLGVACDTLPQGMLLITRDMAVEYANGAAAAYLGTDRQALVDGDLLQKIQLEPVSRAIEGIVTGKTIRRVIHEEQREGEHGKSVLRYIVRPVRSGDQAAAMLIIDDITQQHEAEQARHSFVAHATHELRTPLTNIRAYVETAIDEGGDERRVGDCLNIINEEVLRLDRLIQDMLTVSEVESGGRELKRNDVDVRVMLEKLEADFVAQAEENGIDMAFSLPSKIPTIHGDREKIAATCANLLGNALKYTPDGGTVRVVAKSDERMVTLEFHDTGIGIGAEDLPNIFDKFYRAKDHRVHEITGTGLGLALSRELARLHGGDITVQSDLDQGSTFTLTLPVCQRAGVEG